VHLADLQPTNKRSGAERGTTRCRPSPGKRSNGSGTEQMDRRRTDGSRDKVREYLLCRSASHHSSSNPSVGYRSWDAKPWKCLGGRHSVRSATESLAEKKRVGGESPPATFFFHRVCVCVAESEAVSVQSQTRGAKRQRQMMQSFSWSVSNVIHLCHVLPVVKVTRTPMPVRSRAPRIARPHATTQQHRSPGRNTEHRVSARA